MLNGFKIDCLALYFSKTPQQKHVCWVACVKIATSIFERNAPRQNSMEALDILEVFTAFEILRIAPHILFSFKVPI